MACYWFEGNDSKITVTIQTTTMNDCIHISIAADNNLSIIVIDF